MGCALWELPASVGSRVPAWDTQLWRGVPRDFLHMEEIIRTNSHPSPSDVPGFLYRTEMVWSFISCVTLFNRYLVGQEKNGSVVVCCIACSEFHTLHSTVKILKAVKCRFSRFSVSCLLVLVWKSIVSETQSASPSSPIATLVPSCRQGRRKNIFW